MLTTSKKMKLGTINSINFVNNKVYKNIFTNKEIELNKKYFNFSNPKNKEFSTLPKSII